MGGILCECARCVKGKIDLLHFYPNELVLLKKFFYQRALGVFSIYDYFNFHADLIRSGFLVFHHSHLAGIVLSIELKVVFDDASITKETDFSDAGFCFKPIVVKRDEDGDSIDQKEKSDRKYGNCDPYHI